MRIVALDETSKKDILADLLKRDPNNYTAYSDTVQEIVDTVKRDRDAAVFSYTEQFDHAVIDASTIRVTKEEIEEAMREVEPGLLEVMKRSMKNIRAFHEKQKTYSWFDSKPDGTILGQKITALSSVGVYVPGGKAAYPSSVLMNRGGRSREDRHGNPSGQRRKGQSRDPHRGASCRGDRGL